MKKLVSTALKICCIAGGGIFLISTGYNFIGLFLNSAKNHGWKKAEKEAPKSKRISKQFWDKYMELCDDVLEDVEAGWAFVRG